MSARRDATEGPSPSAPAPPRRATRQSARGKRSRAPARRADPAPALYDPLPDLADDLPWVPPKRARHGPLDPALLDRAAAVPREALSAGAPEGAWVSGVAWAGFPAAQYVDLGLHASFLGTSVATLAAQAVGEELCGAAGAGAGAGGRTPLGLRLDAAALVAEANAMGL